MQYLTAPIVLTQRKASLITVFPQIFRKYSIARKLEIRARIKKMLSATPVIGFFHTKFTTSDLKSKYVFYLTNGDRTWTASVGVLN